MHRIYFDESGRTGRHVFRNGSWNYKQNEYFALGGIVVDGNNVLALQNDIEDVILNLKIQGELKSSNRSVKKIAHVLESKLSSVMDKYNALFYLEIENQKFCDCLWIVSYLVLPYYEMLSTSNHIEDFYTFRLESRVYANYIYAHIDNDTIWKCIETFDSGNYDKNQLLKCCNLLRDDRVLRPLVDKTIDSIKNLPLLDRHFFPLKDSFKNESSFFSISPHIDSFNNILFRVLQNNDLNIDMVIHDEENELSDALSKWAKNRQLNIVFEKSKNNRIIQLADFLTGTILREFTTSFMEDEGGVLNHYLNNINIVSIVDDQLKLFPNDLDSCLVKLQLSDIYSAP